jgi:hypothetical protein
MGEGRSESALVYAVSGLGKTTLATAHPREVADADQFLYRAVAQAFPELDARARLRAWRELCARQPWVDGGDALARWAAVRRSFVEPILEIMHRGAYPLVVTSLLDLPWPVRAYYGVERGRYVEHLGLAGRATDNGQNEAMNERLEGYAPLIRLAPGAFLGDQPEIRAALGSR